MILMDEWEGYYIAYTKAGGQQNGICSQIENSTF